MFDKVRSVGGNFVESLHRCPKKPEASKFYLMFGFFVYVWSSYRPEDLISGFYIS